MSKKHLDLIRTTVDEVKSKMRITKVVATRAIKTKRGDFFAGMSAAWQSVQDDVSGPGADLDLTVDDRDIAVSGMTFREAQVAHSILAMEASIGAHRAALTDGAISKSEFDAGVKQARRNTLTHLSQIIPESEAAAMIDGDEATDQSAAG